MATWRTIGNAGIRMIDVSQEEHDAHFRLKLPVESEGLVTARAYAIDHPSDGTLAVRYAHTASEETESFTHTANGAAGVDAITIDPNLTGPTGAERAQLMLRSNGGAQKVTKHNTLTNLTAAGVKFFL